MHKSLIPLKQIILSIKILVVILLGLSFYAYYSNGEGTYTINSRFTSIPLSYDPDTNTSVYETQKAQISVTGGFVKGIQVGKDRISRVLIRALSPLPSLTITGKTESKVEILLENIAPASFLAHLGVNRYSGAEVTVNTLQFTIPVTTGNKVTLIPYPQSSANAYNQAKYVIMGDNRDGYETFGDIIKQINAMTPAFIIDNGDLVFSGKPNQYRLFDRMSSTIASTLITSLGNHDIRDEGGKIYAMLYGPSYYSFDYADSHFIILDSAPGWVEKTAISAQQYEWLERDLIKAQGKNIFVITHIPPRDPRTETKPTLIPTYANEVKKGNNWFMQKLDSYLTSKLMYHGFQDPVEALKFETLMSTYHVNTVYLSHIHTFMEYTKDKVRYMITGGAGAELLSTDSYYHFMVTGFDGSRNTLMIELPSPPTNYIQRYWSAGLLFAQAMIDENPLAAGLFATMLGMIVVLIILESVKRRRRALAFIRSLVKRVKNLFRKNKKISL